MSRISMGIGVLLVVAIAAIVYSGRMSEESFIPSQATSTPATSTARAATSTVAKTIQQKVVAAATSTKEILESINILPQPVNWKRGIATVFWVGEGETAENDYIHNSWSAWDMRWEEHYGGVDDPENRCGFQPCAFEPKENPFYVALPYNDLENNGKKKANATRIPWNDPAVKKSVLKNRWIEVRHDGKTCYGQWQDVGPFEQDDVEYVFGDAKEPQNPFGEKAGIDLSPALADCLGVDGSDDVQWRHVEFEHVPKGDWTKIITTRL
jgi:hypothetical protein